MVDLQLNDSQTKCANINDGGQFSGARLWSFLLYWMGQNGVNGALQSFKMTHDKIWLDVGPPGEQW